MNYRDGSAFPAAHDTAREARRRLAVGVSGVILMFLLVGLVGMFTGQVRKAEEAKVQAGSPSSPVVGGAAGQVPVAADPLGDVTDPQPSSLPAAEQPIVPAAGAGGVVVPDLQPDPQLKASGTQR
jgi:hypothetical protein